MTNKTMAGFWLLLIIVGITRNHERVPADGSAPPLAFTSNAHALPTKREDRRFLNNGDRTITDTKTGLMWAASDNGSIVDWLQAERYVKTYSGGGHSDWRLPTAKELKGLYDAADTRYTPTCSPDTTTKIPTPSMIRLSCGAVWALETRDTKAALFNFFVGNIQLQEAVSSYGHGALVLPVRTGSARAVSDRVSPESLLSKEETHLPKAYRNIMGMEFVLIPAGEFEMGDIETTPIHHVRISRPFYIGKYEITQGQWKTLEGTNPSYYKGEELPVHGVLWNDVQEFIRKLNSQERGDYYRLPTEAEWEYACRAGMEGDHAGDLNSMAWYEGDKPHSVGLKKPNAWGVYDMHGNVFELVQDWYGPYPNRFVIDPEGPSSGPNRVIRGGGWGSSSWYCRSANRDFCEDGNFGRGLRLVKLAIKPNR